MKKRQEIINQVFFVVVVLFIVFLLWGYGSGWLGVSADYSRAERTPKNFISQTAEGINKLREKSIFKDEVQTPSDYLFEQAF